WPDARRWAASSSPSAAWPRTFCSLRPIRACARDRRREVRRSKCEVRRGDGMKATGSALLIAIVLVAVAAPWLAPNPPDRQFNNYFYAPPTRMHLFGGGRALYFYPLRIVNRLERRFEEVRDHPVRIAWFDGRLVTS